MGGVLVLLLGLLVAGGVVAGAFYYLWREKQRLQHEQELRFRSILLQQLRKRGPAGLDINRLIDEADVSHETALQAASSLYAGYCRQALADNRVTPAERQQLDRLLRAFAIPVEVGKEIEERCCAEKYRDAAFSVLAEGQITPQEMGELQRVRDNLGLTTQQAEQIVGASGRDGYLALFRRVIADGRITAEELEELRRYRKALGISDASAQEIVRQDAMGLYRQWFYNVMQDGEVTAQEEQGLAWLRQEFGLHGSEADVFEEQLREAKLLAAFRRGELPTLNPTKLLESGEICHWDGECTYQWATSVQAKQAQGELIVTSERLVFSSLQRSFSFSPSKIMDVTLYNDAIKLATASSRGAGVYFVSRPRELEAIIVGLARRHKFQLSVNYSSSLSRHIPDAVRREVWQRDGGKCVRCSAIDYLEYDHIIPHSRGGANTVANVQILCRRCNNAKSDRI